MATPLPRLQQIMTMCGYFARTGQNSASSDSTTPERLSVIDLAWLTKSSFKVRLTGRLRAAALNPRSNASP
jgi:hypothetical protein